MCSYKNAALLVKTFEGFNEKAYCDPNTGKDPYTLGYGTQFYPDGSKVKQGHCCTKEKAQEYLQHEIKIIAEQLDKLKLDLNLSMKECLISFVHSIGWDAFLYSEIIDLCEHKEYVLAADEFSKWIFDSEHQVIGGLIDRRRQEAKLFLKENDDNPWTSDQVLLKAFRNYAAAPHQVRAIRELEQHINPYVLSVFANNFSLGSITDIVLSDEELRGIFEIQR